MHLSDMNWWRYAAGRWIQHWHGRKVLELGSYDVNGTIRPLFHSCKQYIGVDWRPGPGVDFVSLAHEVPFPEETFGAVVSSSMLEHDPHWEWTLETMCRVLRKDGVLMLSWGAAGNNRHCADSCPDYAEAKRKGEHMELHHALPAGQALEQLLFRQHCTFQEFRYQDQMPFNRHCWKKKIMPGNAKDAAQRKLALKADCFASLVAFKDKKYCNEPRYIDQVKPQDKVGCTITSSSSSVS